MKYVSVCYKALKIYLSIILSLTLFAVMASQDSSASEKDALNTSYKLQSQIQLYEDLKQAEQEAKKILEDSHIMFEANMLTAEEIFVANIKYFEILNAYEESEKKLSELKQTNYVSATNRETKEIRNQ